MAKMKPTEISVTTVYSGKQDGRQAIIELILIKHREINRKIGIDGITPEKYNQSKVFSDVRVM